VTHKGDGTENSMQSRTHIDSIVRLEEEALERRSSAEYLADAGGVARKPSLRCAPPSCGKTRFEPAMRRGLDSAWRPTRKASSLLDNRHFAAKSSLLPVQFRSWHAANEALQQLKPRFNGLYAKTGRPSIAPEKLLRALLCCKRCTRCAGRASRISSCGS
jgi:hypothetical protein